MRRSCLHRRRFSQVYRLAFGGRRDWFRRFHSWVHAFLCAEDFERAELGSDCISHRVPAGHDTDGRPQPEFLRACSIAGPRTLDEYFRNSPNTDPGFGVGFFV
jgi:hypothetical protein